MTRSTPTIESPDGPHPAAGQDKWIDEQLRRMAQRSEIFERILNRSPGLLLIVRREEGWPIEYLSDSVARLGYEAQAMIGASDGLMSIVHEDDRDRIEMEADFWCQQADREDFRLEFRCRSASGEIQWLDTHLWLRRDVRGRVHRMQGIAWDITERKRAERLQRLAVQVVELLNCPDESREIIRNILEMMRFYSEIRSAAIHLVREDGSLDCIESGFEGRAPLDPGTCPLVASVIDASQSARTCAKHAPVGADEVESLELTDGGSIWSAHVPRIPCVEAGDSCLARGRDGASVAPPGTLAMIPLRAAGEIVGMLQLCDDRPGQCDAETIAAFEGLGFSIGIALDRERTTRRLLRSEDRYRALFDTSQDGIAMLSLDHRIEAANPALVRTIGTEILDPDSAPIWTRFRAPRGSTSTTCVPGALCLHGFTEDFEREIVAPDGSHRTVVVRSWTVRDDLGRPRRTLLILRDIEEQRRAEREITRLVTAIEQSAEIVIVSDFDSRIEYVNPTFEKVTGYRRDDVLGMDMREMRDPDTPSRVYEDLRARIQSGQVYKGRIAQRRRDGRVFQVDLTISPVRDHAGDIVNFVTVQRDVTEIMQLESQLLQAQKLESIGRLAAGIAHEINTPSQYVGDNVRFLQDAFEDFMKVMAVGEKLTRAASERPDLAEQAAVVQGVVDDVDLDYLAEEIPRAIQQSLEGLDRVSRIVGAMKYFSHPGVTDIAPIDIHQAIESTVTVARNEWKYDAELELDFDDDMPTVPCLANEFNQVVLNLVINAVHAIQARHGDSGRKGRIVVRTRREDDFARIEVQDDGAGIPDDVAARVFDPFFTTKDVGSGTGQGLAIARDVVVGKHGGRIDFDSTPGEGTTFRLWIPLQAVARGRPGGESCAT